MAKLALFHDEADEKGGVMDASLELMYQEIILEASKHPHGREHFAHDFLDESGEVSHQLLSQSADQTSGRSDNDTTVTGDGQSATAIASSRRCDLTSPSEPSQLTHEPGVGFSTKTAIHETCSVGQSHQFNPTCGDEVTVRVELSAPNRAASISNTNAAATNMHHTIKRLVWDGQGCSICLASLSIMTDLVSNCTLEDALNLADLFHQLMRSRGLSLIHI